MAFTIHIDGTDRTSLLLSGTLRVSPRADHRSDCSLRIKTTANGYLPYTGQDLQVKDGTEIIFGGVIKTKPMHRPGVGTGGDTTIFVDITSDGYFSIPGRRTVSMYYTGQTAGYIVGQLITTCLNEEGVTAGTINDGAALTSYIRGAISVKDVLDDMADASGYKWYIDDSKQLHFIQDDTVMNAAHDIIEGGEFTDFADVYVEEQLELYRNKQVIKGGILEDGSTFVYSKQLDAEIAARAAIEGGSGVYGNVFEDVNIVTDAEAAKVADNLLKKFGTVPITLNFSSLTNDWRAGTRLNVHLPTFGIESSLAEIPEGYTPIYTAAELDDIRNNLNPSGNIDGKYIQMADIDLGVAPWNTGTGWVPIGTEMSYFDGEYDFNGYTISNLTINQPSAGYNTKWGLFGKIAANAVVKNGTFENVDIYAGGNTSIRAGGVIGEASGGLIQDLSVDGRVETSTESDNRAGGIVGGDSGTIMRCKADVTVISSVAGGIAGVCGGAGEVSEECFSVGSVTGSSMAGGLVGWFVQIGSTSSIEDCYSFADVGGAAATKGGLVGQLQGDVSVENSYSAGSVAGSGATIGGLVGGDFSSLGVINSYYNSATAGQSDTGKGEPRTTTQMTIPYDEATTYIDWDFVDVWGINAVINDGYPYLLWMANSPAENTYFLIEEVSIIDLGGQVLQSRVTATKRGGTGFSTQRSGDYVDYFGDLTRQIKNAASQAQAARVAAADDYEPVTTGNTTTPETLYTHTGDILLAFVRRIRQAIGI